MTTTEADTAPAIADRFASSDAADILGYSRTELENVLRATAQELEEHGWCQGVLRDLEGRHCLIGALHVATYQNHIYGAALSCLWDQLALSKHDPGLSPMRWNDQAGRTAEQVVALCNATADRIATKARKR